MSYAFCVKHQQTMTLREIERGKTIYICAKCERERQEAMRRITFIQSLPFFVLLMVLPAHASHRSQFVAETMSELQHDAAVAKDYADNPPRYTSPQADSLYISRALADLDVAYDALNKYKHHHCSEQDVRTAVSQLERDLEDIPPAHWPDLVTSVL